MLEEIVTACHHDIDEQRTPVFIIDLSDREINESRIKSSCCVLGSLTDHLFEVSMEVNFSLDVSESWDEMAKLLLLWVKNLVRCLKLQIYC